MPHTGHILHGRYAVVSCHVERPLDDEVWRRFSALQAAPAGRLRDRRAHAAPAAGEDEARWLERAREAEARGPFGLHTHWTAPDHARPTDGRSGRARARAGPRGSGRSASRRRFFCGGGWYLDERVADAVADARLRRLHRDRVQARVSRGRRSASAACDEPTWLELGRRTPPARAADDALDRHARARHLRAAHPAGRSCTRTSTTPTCSTGGARRRCVSGSVVLGLQADAVGPRRASAWLASREDDVVREQPRVKRHEASGDEVELRVVEAGEQRAHVGRREHLKVRRVVLGLAAERETARGS